MTPAPASPTPPPTTTPPPVPDVTVQDPPLSVTLAGDGTATFTVGPLQLGNGQETSLTFTTKWVPVAAPALDRRER